MAEAEDDASQSASDEESNNDDSTGGNHVQRFCDQQEDDGDVDHEVIHDDDYTQDETELPGNADVDMLLVRLG